jgi:hypothetical protein
MKSTKARSAKIVLPLHLLTEYLTQEKLVSEMAHACKDHGHVVLIGSINHLCIPYGPAGMNYCNSSGLEGLIQSVSEGEE